MPCSLDLDPRLFATIAVEHTGETNPWWLWPNLLSLDAPLVAVAWQSLFARYFHVPANAAASLVLLLTVWLLYVVDRCFDTLRSPEPGSGESPRHRFYRLHRRHVLPFTIAAICGIVFLALTALPGAILASGFVIANAVLIYFGLVHLAAWKGCKELAVAVLFALGVCAPAAAMAPAFSAAAILPASLFTMLCWLNCAAIDLWEPFVTDRRAATQWIARHLPSAAVLVIGIAIAGCACTSSPIFAALAVSGFAFLLLHLAQPHLSANALRVLADLALLSPLPFLVLSTR